MPAPTIFLVNLECNAVIRLTKIDAARSQLRTAIRLFFAQADPVSTHALASAAQDVLRGLLQARDLQWTSIKDTDIIDPAKRKLWYQAMNREQNFFKHADRDPDEILVFNPDIVPFILYDDTMMYRTLSDGRNLRETAAFSLWFVLKFPHFLPPDVIGADPAQFPIARSIAATQPGAFLVLLDRPELWPDTD